MNVMKKIAHYLSLVSLGVAFLSHYCGVQLDRFAENAGLGPFASNLVYFGGIVGILSLQVEYYLAQKEENERREHLSMQIERALNPLTDLIIGANMEIGLTESECAGLLAEHGQSGVLTQEQIYRATYLKPLGAFLADFSFWFYFGNPKERVKADGTPLFPIAYSLRPRENRLGKYGGLNRQVSFSLTTKTIKMRLNEKVDLEYQDGSMPSITDLFSSFLNVQQINIPAERNPLSITEISFTTATTKLYIATGELEALPNSPNMISHRGKVSKGY